MMSFVFCMTWWFGYPAYIRDPNKETPDFYPIFMVLNSWSGVFVFCLLGIVSKPFRATFVRTRWTSGKRSDGLIGKIVSDAKCSIRDLVFTRDRSNSQTKEMSNWIGPIVKQLWNYAMHVLHKFLMV